MKKAKIVIADNEDGKGWFIYRVDYVSENDEFVEDSEEIQRRKGITIEKTETH